MIVADEWSHDDVIKWKKNPRYWRFVRGNSPVIGEPPSQRPVTLSFDVLCDLRLNKRLLGQTIDAGDLRRHRAHYDVTVMKRLTVIWWWPTLPSSICTGRCELLFVFSEIPPQAPEKCQKWQKLVYFLCLLNPVQHTKVSQQPHDAITTSLSIRSGDYA